MCSAISDWFTTATLAPKGIIKGPAGEFGELMFYIEHTLKKSPSRYSRPLAQRLLKIQGHWQCALLGGWFTTATLAPKGIIKGPAGESGEPMFYP